MEAVWGFNLGLSRGSVEPDLAHGWAPCHSSGSWPQKIEHHCVTATRGSDGLQIIQMNTSKKKVLHHTEDRRLSSASRRLNTRSSEKKGTFTSILKRLYPWLLFCTYYSLDLEETGSSGKTDFPCVNFRHAQGNVYFLHQTVTTVY